MTKGKLFKKIAASSFLKPNILEEDFIDYLLDSEN